MKRPICPDEICGATPPSKKRKPLSLPDRYRSTLSHVRRWIETCDNSDINMAPPRPSSAASNESGRRTYKLLQRRSPSPVKKDSPRYRARNMADANIYVDHKPDLPSFVADEMKIIFNTTDLSSIGAGQSNPTMPDLADQYCTISRQLAKDCAGEGEWKSSLLAVVLKPMQASWPLVLKLSGSEKPWLGELRPNPRSLADILGNVPTLSHGLSTETTIQPLQANVSYTPSDNNSDVTTDDPNRVSIPKPDVTLGLAHDSFGPVHGKILWVLQDNGDVLSDPHRSNIGLHFPFIVVEAKGLAAGSSMVGAQNQAAVDGACAVRIFQDLVSYASATHLRTVFFSLVTEGPLHELWVHYQVEESYHMTILKVWRSTFQKDSMELVQSLYHILCWGQSTFRESIVEVLERIAARLRESGIDDYPSI